MRLSPVIFICRLSIWAVHWSHSLGNAPACVVLFVFWGKVTLEKAFYDYIYCGHFITSVPLLGLLKQNSILYLLFLGPVLLIVHLGVRQICLETLSNPDLRRQNDQIASSIFPLLSVTFNNSENSHSQGIHCTPLESTRAMGLLLLCNIN